MSRNHQILEIENQLRRVLEACKWREYVYQVPTRYTSYLSSEILETQQDVNIHLKGFINTIDDDFEKEIIIKH